LLLTMEGFAQPSEASEGCVVECRLDCAHDLAALLAALQLRDREQKDLRVHCEASGRGLKFVTQSSGKDVAVLGWIFHNAFKEYRYAGTGEELHLRLPVAPMLCCLQVFSDRASMVLRYPDGPSDELHFTLEEEGATTECHVKTLVLEEAPATINSIFSAGDALSYFRPTQADTWYLALSELQTSMRPMSCCASRCRQLLWRTSQLLFSGRRQSTAMPRWNYIVGHWRSSSWPQVQLQLGQLRTATT